MNKIPPGQKKKPRSLKDMKKKLNSKEIIALIEGAWGNDGGREGRISTGHPETKGNGYYRRELITGLMGIKGFRVPRTRDGNFHSVFLPWQNKCQVTAKLLGR